MRAITKGVGSTYTEPEPGSLNVTNIKSVLIVRPNHRLGNQLLLTPIVQEVISTFPNCKIDILAKGGVAYPVFEKYKEINNIIQLPRKPFSNLFKYAKVWISVRQSRYDMVINGDKNSSSGRLLTNLAKADFKIFGDVNEDIQNKHADYEHIAKYPVYNLRHFVKRLGDVDTKRPVPLLDIKLETDEVANGKTILDTITKNNRKTICIYTNATGDKCYSEDWWETFYARLLKEFPNYNIIEMLPIENISKINFKAPHFYSKDIREMGAIIKNTSIFIAADNGVMHLASASLTPTVGFFSVTSEAMYRPYGNGSMSLNTNNTTIDHWISEIKNILNLQ